MNKLIIITIFLIGCIYMSSCRQEDNLIENKETTTFTLNIGTQESSASISRNQSSDTNLLPYEGIRTLRVLVISDNEDPKQRKILYNAKHTIDNNESPTEAKLSAKLTLENIPVGKSSIYLIANEESIGMEYTDNVLTEDKYKEDNKLLLLDEGWLHFPKTYDEISKTGLPMSGKIENVDIQSGMADQTIYLERTIVKLRLTVENATSGNLNLKWIKFGKFISDRVYMYPTLALDIPNSTLYKELRNPENEGEYLNTPLGPTNKTEIYMYIYPNFAYKDPIGSNPYTLALETDKKLYQPSLIGNNINSMRRNTYVDITARITASTTISVDYQFVGWKSADIEVPPFN